MRKNLPFLKNHVTDKLSMEIFDIPSITTEQGSKRDLEFSFSQNRKLL